MKNIEYNPANVSIAVIYCFFGVLSFFVLKIASKYFMRGEKNQRNKRMEKNAKNISRKYLQRVNFSKVFLKTYFLKNTLLGSMLNNDKKYLLKQIFVLSCIAVSCFNINNYIMWPWAIGLGTSLATLIISQIFIPMISSSNQPIEVVDHQQMASNLNEISSMDSIQIETNIQVKMTLSVQRQQSTSRKVQQRPKPQTINKPPNLQLFFIMLLAFISQVLISVCIVKLSLSVSNSGILNLISFGIAILIDQVATRIFIGLITYLNCLALHKTKFVKLFENDIFYSCCSQAISQDLKRVHEEVEIEALKNKIANQTGVPSKIMNNTGAKFIHQNNFSYHEQVGDKIMISLAKNFQQKAVLEEQEDDKEPQVEPQIKPQVQPLVNNQNQLEKQKDIVKDETNFFELYEHDIKTFTQEMLTTERSNGKVKKIKKRVKPQEKFKSDKLVYFPYEEHKLSSHRNSVKHDLKQFENEMSLFEKQRASINENILKNIEALQCNDDSLVTEEDVIGTILNEKNFNIKTLTINEKVQIPPTSRPGHSALKRSVSKESIAAKKVKKVSPYLVDLQSQVVKPQKSQKTKKLMVSKVNKENANQTNQSFMPSETIEGSRITQKDFAVRNNWMNSENVTIGRRQ